MSVGYPLYGLGDVVGPGPTGVNPSDAAVGSKPRHLPTRVATRVSLNHAYGVGERHVTIEVSAQLGVPEPAHDATVSDGACFAQRDDLADQSSLHHAVNACLDARVQFRLAHATSDPQRGDSTPGCPVLSDPLRQRSSRQPAHFEGAYDPDSVVRMEPRGGRRVHRTQFVMQRH
jgi:hypothetical protein